jgi:glycosyltransferase involved in cell wall biosynthesis
MLRQIKIASFPDLDYLSTNPYWKILKDDIEREGYENAIAADFRLKWLFNHRNQVQILHFHYVHQFYEYEYDYARLLWVMRFARNLIVAKVLGYKIIFTLHDLTPTFRLEPEWVNMLGYRIIVSLANRVIVHCEEARRLLAQKYHRKRSVVTVEHPAFVGYYQNNISKIEARIKLGLDSHQFVFGFFGGIRPNKGIEKLIDAFGKIPSTKVVLLIAGSPNPPLSYSDEIRRLAQQDSRIILMDRRIDDNDVQVILNASNVMVLPFSRILTSGSAMLALSFGCPVIAPKMGCLPELIGENYGWLYEPDDPEGLESALNLALTADVDKISQRILRHYGERKQMIFAQKIYEGFFE